jgi:AraC-like DNA-binding protein
VLKFIDFLDYAGLVIVSGLMLLLLLKHPKKKTDQYLFAALFLILGTSVLDLVGETAIDYTISGLLQILIGPILFIYMKTLMDEKSTLKYGLHLLFPLFNLAVIVSIFSLGWSDDVYYESALFYIWMFINFISLITYGILMITTYVKFKWTNKKANQQILSWSGVLVFTYMGYTLINFGYLFLYNVGDDENWVWLIDSIVSLLLLAVIATKSYQLGIIYPREKKAEPSNTESDEKWLELFQRIDKTIKAEQLYLNPQLKIEALAKRMTTNSRYISKAVNAGYGDSVTNYLNELRLELFKQKLNDSSNHHLNIDALAMECGFNSKSSFNRFFKLKEEITPSEYRARETKTGE